MRKNTRLKYVSLSQIFINTLNKIGRSTSLFCVNSTQAKVILEKRNSVENVCPLNWIMGKFVVVSLDL